MGNGKNCKCIRCGEFKNKDDCRPYLISGKQFGNHAECFECIEAMIFKWEKENGKTK